MSLVGKQNSNEVIAYQLRQSFKPGEVTAEEANQIGYQEAGLQPGDTVTFTDVDGNVFTYTVREFASVTPDDSDTVMNSGYALTMYTCNWDTSERVTVFCERTGGEIPGENG